jgi:hypothetical protein
MVTKRILRVALDAFSDLTLGSIDDGCIAANESVGAAW